MESQGRNYLGISRSRILLDEHRVVQVVAVLLVVGSALHFLGRSLADPDLWAHLHYGRMILESHGLPRVDVFSYTAPGASFYNHEWLFDLVCAGVFTAFGSAGLVIGKFLLLGAMVAFLVGTARALRDILVPGHEIHPLTAALVLILGLAVIGPGATFRAQLFTMVFLAAEHWLLTRVERRRLASNAPAPSVSWELWVLPPLFAVWANLHGGFLVGVGLLGIYLGVASAEQCLLLRDRSLRGAAARRLGLFIAVGLAALLAPLVNPYGWELYAYLARTLGMHDLISEWRPIGLLSDEFLRFKLMVVLTAIGIAISWPRRRVDTAPLGSTLSVLWRGVFLLAAAYAAFRHQRHSVLFAVVATPFLVVAFDRLRRMLMARWPSLQPSRSVLVAAVAGALAISFFQMGVWTRDLREHGLGIRYGRLDYPIDAVQFMKTYGLEGNVAMPFEWAAYAITKLGPESRVFIDGRFEAVYPPAIIDDYFSFLSGQSDWERLLDAYPTEIVVVQRWRGIHPRLFARADLHYVYSDPAALVFVREGPNTAAALARIAAAENRHDFSRLATYFP